MLGSDATRLNELEAENRVLREELHAQTLRAEALAKILRTQRAENDALVQQVNAMATARQRDARQVDGETVTAAGAMMRLCWN